MTRAQVLDRIAELGVVAVIRMQDPRKLAEVVSAISAGGVKAIEVTMSVPNAVAMIAELARTLPGDIVLGAGTVTDVGTARAVIDAGARFVVSPVLSLAVVASCSEAGVACMPGCYTPTEIFTAWSAGADVVKVFPATALGPKYLKDLAGPFPQIKVMPTGGVSIDNVGEWVAAGAFAVGIGSDLLDKGAIADGRYEVLTERAARMTANFQKAAAARR